MPDRSASAVRLLSSIALFIACVAAGAPVAVRRAGNYVIVEQGDLRLSVTALCLEAASVGGRTLLGPVFLRFLTVDWKDVGSEMAPLETGTPTVTVEGDTAEVRTSCVIGRRGDEADGRWQVGRVIRVGPAKRISLGYQIETLEPSRSAAYIYVSARLPRKEYVHSEVVVEAASRVEQRDGKRIQTPAPEGGFTGKYGGVFQYARSLTLKTSGTSQWSMASARAVRALGLHAWDWTYEVQWTTSPSESALAFEIDFSGVRQEQTALPDATASALIQAPVQPRAHTALPTERGKRIAADQREEICLNGEWDFLPAGTDAAPEADAPWIRLNVPALWRHDEYDMPDPGFKKPYGWTEQRFGRRSASSGWYRLRFTLPAGWDDGREAVLEMEGVRGQADVFLDSVTAARSGSAHLPVVIPVAVSQRGTDSRELLVHVRANEKRQTPGIWRDVFLRSRPRVRVANVRVSTSVRRKSIAIRAWIENRDAVAHSVSLTPTVWLGSERILTLAPVAATLEPGARKQADASTSWPEPILWGFEPYGRPVLYTCHTELHENASLLDARDDRFGCREFWLEGQSFVLNGHRIFLKGDLIGPSYDIARNRRLIALYYLAQRQANINFIRIHARHGFPHPLWLSVADELGMLIEPQSYLHRDTPARYETLKAEWCHFVESHWNHPSVVMWSSDNEACSQAAGLAPEDVFRRLDEIHMLIRGLDPDRPIESQGNVQLGVASKLGLYRSLEVFNAHPYGRPLGWALKQLMLRYECPPDVPIHVGEIYFGYQDPFNWWTRPAEMLRRQEVITRSYDNCGRFYHESILSVAEAGARGASLCSGSGNLYWGPTASGEYRLGPWHDLIKDSDESFDIRVTGEGKVVGRAINTVYTRVKWPSLSGVGARPDLSLAYLGHTGRGLAHNFWDPSRPPYVANLTHGWVRQAYRDVDGQDVGPLAATMAPELLVSVHLNGRPLTGAYVVARHQGETWQHGIGVMTDKDGTAWICLPEAGAYDVSARVEDRVLSKTITTTPRQLCPGPKDTFTPGYGDMLWLELGDRVAHLLKARLAGPVETEIRDHCETRTPGPEELAPLPTSPGPHAPDADGFLRTFLVCGPFPNVGDRERGFEGFRTDWLKEHGGETAIRPTPGMSHDVTFPEHASWKAGKATVSWRGMTSDRALFGFEGLILPAIGLGVMPPQYVVGYAACTLLSEREREVTAAVGSDDGHKVWLNGVLVGQRPEHGGAVKDGHKYRTRLRSGENHLLVKVDQSFGGYGFYLRFLSDDKPVTDLAAYLVAHPLRFGPRQLTADGAEHPCFSPDGTRVVYSCVQDGVECVCLLDVVGGERRTLCPGSDPAWSPVDDLIVFCRKTGQHSELWQARATGDSPLRLVVRDGDCLFPTFAPDGKSVLFTFIGKGYAERGLRKLDLQNKQSTALTTGSETQACLSPDGSHMAYIAPDAADANCLFVQDMATGKRRRLTKGGGTQGGAGFPAWSPDGKWIAYTRASIQPNSDIHMVELNTGEIRPLTTDQKDNTQACWAPDRECLVLVSRRDTGNRQLWLLPRG